jgi:hypothetical protein
VVLGFAKEAPMNLFLVLVTSVFVTVGGAKVKVKEEAPGLLAKAKVTVDAAAADAQARVPGARLVGAEIEQENGKLIYSFDFKTKGKTGSDEVTVDATTGAVLTVEHESPRSEAQERADEAKKGARPSK